MSKMAYAKNFLIPQKQAICFTQANAKIFEAQKSEFEKDNAKKLDEANKIKAKINGKDVIILQNASDDGRLYGSVNSLLIASKVNDLVGDKAIVRNQIILSKSIKEVGLYDATIALHSDVEANVRLIVTRSESEIKALLKAAEKESKSEEVAPAKQEEKQEQEA